MMDLQSINAANRAAQEKAALKNTRPFIVCEQDLATWKRGEGLPIPFPYIGDHEPAGFERDGEALFVDISGFGEAGERALSVAQMLAALKPSKGYAFIEVGQFQAYLQPYRVLSYRHARPRVVS